jgi:hypothetical protein
MTHWPVAQLGDRLGAARVGAGVLLGQPERPEALPARDLG